MRKAILTLIIFATLIPFTMANAQAKGDINFSIYPENPGPNEPVTISIESYSADLNLANIRWIVDGKVYKTGYGITSITTNTGSLGTSKDISVIATTREGGAFQDSIKIVPASVDLIWESDNFTPPFYKGKSMYIHENKISVIALPHFVSGGKEISPKNLVYTWKNNGDVIQSASGYGKNVYTLTGSLISRPLNIEVEVSSPNTNNYSRAQTTIEPKESEIIIYEKDPLYGINFAHGLTGTYELKGKEVTLMAMPMFFSSSIPNQSGFEYKWLINGSPTDSDPWEYMQVFRTKDDAEGTAKISVNLKNKSRILQYASNTFYITFNKKTVSSEL